MVHVRSAARGIHPDVARSRMMRRRDTGRSLHVSSSFRTGALVAALSLLAAAGCSERIAGSIGCPELCTDQSAQLRDTILVGAVVLDTSLVGFPRLGDTRTVALQNRGDTADVRLIARFDTLPTSYIPSAPQADSLVRRVDSTTLIFLIDTLSARPTSSVIIDAFDVDTVAADTLRSALLPLFRPGRRIGSQTFTPAQLTDTLRLTLSDSAILRKVRDTTRLRIGLQIRNPVSGSLRVLAGSFQPRIRFRVSTDTLVHPDTVFLRSGTPTGSTDLANGFVVYPLYVKGVQPIAPAGQLAVSGLSGSRSYLRFDLPAILLDSVQVVRASLLLTQLPARPLARVSDTITILTQPVIASPSLTDVGTAAGFLGEGGVFAVDALRLVPRDSGARSIEIVSTVRLWQVLGVKNTTRALVLRSPQEGENPGEILFVSSEGSPALRPRLRITYVPRRGFGLP